MNIDEILNLMDDMLEKAWSVPLSGGKCMIDVEQVSALVDDIRLNLPMEIKHAKAIVADRAEIVNNAKKEAADIIAKAEKRARMLVVEHEITKSAKEKGDEFVTSAQLKSRQMRKAATDYVDKMMSATEKSLITSLTEVREVKKEFHKKNQF